MSTELTVAAVAGLAAPVLTHFITKSELRGTYKRLIAIGVTLLLTGIGILAAYRPDTWQEIAAVLAAAIGVMQVVYTAMKPVLDAAGIKLDSGEGDSHATVSETK